MSNLAPAAIILALLIGGVAAHAQKNEAPVTRHAKGTFEVKLTPQPDKQAAEGITRMLIDKHFHGDLEATAQGAMLTATTGEKASAGYVAIERITGSLQGHTGSFLLQHSGTLNRGVPEQSVTVVPDSGTGQLKGITGSMSILIEEGGKHSYEFEYTLPE